MLLFYSTIIRQIRFVVTDRAAYVLNSWSPAQQNLNHASIFLQVYIKLNLTITKVFVYLCTHIEDIFRNKTFFNNRFFGVFQEKILI